MDWFLKKTGSNFIVLLRFIKENVGHIRVYDSLTLLVRLVKNKNTTTVQFRQTGEKIRFWLPLISSTDVRVYYR